MLRVVGFQNTYQAAGSDPGGACGDHCGSRFKVTYTAGGFDPHSRADVFCKQFDVFRHGSALSETRRRLYKIGARIRNKFAYVYLLRLVQVATFHDDL